MAIRKHTALFSLLIMGFFLLTAASYTDTDHLKGKTIVIDAGHGGTADIDSYRVGPAGEREEWINLRVALRLEELLLSRGATVIMTRTEDVQVELADRAEMAVENDADLFLSIHHNATADPQVNFPIIYFHGNAGENTAGAALAVVAAKKINKNLFDGKNTPVVASDHTIFPGSGTAVLRTSYGIPGIITEASFFTHPDEEGRLKEAAYNELEAQALLQTIESYFELETHAIHERYSRVKLPPFEVLQEAERMDPSALTWREDFDRARQLLESDHPSRLKEACKLATQSARSFPDSPVARESHLIRSDALERLGKTEEATTAPSGRRNFMFRWSNKHIRVSMIF